MKVQSSPSSSQQHGNSALQNNKKSAENSEILIWNVNKPLYKGTGRPKSEKSGRKSVVRGLKWLIYQNKTSIHAGENIGHVTPKCRTHNSKTDEQWSLEGKWQKVCSQILDMSIRWQRRRAETGKWHSICAKAALISKSNYHVEFIPPEKHPPAFKTF